MATFAAVQALPAAPDRKLNLMKKDLLLNTPPYLSDVEATTESELTSVTEEPIDTLSYDLTDVKADAESELISSTEEPMNLSSDHSTNVETTTETELISSIEEPIDASVDDVSDGEASEESELVSTEDLLNSSSQDLTEAQILSKKEMSEAQVPIKSKNSPSTMSQSYLKDAVQQHSDKTNLNSKASIRQREQQATIQGLISLDRTIKNLTPVLPRQANSFASMNEAVFQLSELLSKFVESLPANFGINTGANATNYLEVPKEVYTAIEEVYSAIEKAIENAYPSFPNLVNSTLSFSAQVPVTAIPAESKHIRARPSQNSYQSLFGMYPAVSKTIPPFYMDRPQFVQNIRPHLFNSFAAERNPLLPAFSSRVEPPFRYVPFYSTFSLNNPSPQYYSSRTRYGSPSYYFSPQKYWFNTASVPQFYMDGFRK